MASEYIEKYGALWPPQNTDLDIEMHCIRAGGQWKTKSGVVCGLGLFKHYRNIQHLLWPEEDDHRWSDLILREILTNQITVLAGPKDSGKTHGMCKFALVDYFTYPQHTLSIISSTTLPALEGRIWGDVKGMWARAKARYPDLPGVVLDSKHAICTDDLSDEAVLSRDMRKGIICLACKTSSGTFNYSAVSTYVGMKQKRRRMYADEFQFMSMGMFDALGNVNSGDFKLVVAGNPIAQNDPLDKISEPKCGWEAMPEPAKTATWENKLFLRSRTVNLVGTDSPNFDFPDRQPPNPPKYWYLINQDSIDRVVAGYGLDSAQFWTNCKGVRKAGLNLHRVITRQMCEEHGATQKDVIWESPDRTKVYGLDAAYGGDRCVGGWAEFGANVEGKIVLLVHPPKIVPVALSSSKEPEDQIAAYVKKDCESLGIPPANMGHDATGRGSLGTALAKIWGITQPIEFGGTPTERPVSLDFYVTDKETGGRRMKRCDEHYRKFVTELWYSVRYAIQAGQIRGLTEDVIEEGCMREWRMVAGDRIEVESKEDMKERIGRSPDLFDWLSIVVEMARRRGFQIAKLASMEVEQKNNDWLIKLHDEHKQFRRLGELNYEAA